MNNQTPENFPNSQMPNNNKPANAKPWSIAGLVCGIIATVLAWFYMINIVALACGIVGLICSIKGRKLAQAAGQTSGIGTAGLVLAIVGTSLAGIGFLSCTLCVICVANAAGTTAGIFSGLL